VERISAGHGANRVKMYEEIGRLLKQEERELRKEIEKETQKGLDAKLN